jgi:hypothetical protein
MLVRMSEQIGVGADAGHDGLDLPSSGYLEPVGLAVVVRGGIQEVVQVANDPIAACDLDRHRCSCHTFK